jgi:tRNA threonylcarbamoyladenosine biosynthesis protein TsaE
VNSKHLFLANQSAQQELAAKIALLTPAGAVIYLQGELGSGKTTFVRGFLHALGYQGVVKSPTYTLVEPYDIDHKEGHKKIYHFDLYRLVDANELEYAGGRDYFDGESICLVEWPEKAEGFLPRADIQCVLSYENEGRRAKITAHTAVGEAVLAALSY